MRSSGAPQLVHFPCAAAARFVVVTWVICQVATDCCGRAKPRWQLIWSALAEELCIEQFMEFGLCEKCANSVCSLNQIGTSPFLFKGLIELFFAKDIFVRRAGVSAGEKRRCQK